MKSDTTVKDPIRQQTFGINYRWSMSDGTICSRHTVAFGRNRAHAERRFFRRNRHVAPNPEEL